MKLFVLTEISNSKTSGFSVSNHIFGNIEDARQSIADDMNLIHQYGLGDNFEMNKHDFICDNGGEELQITGGHNPGMTYNGTDITVWYGQNDEVPSMTGQFRRFIITEAEVIGDGRRGWRFEAEEEFFDCAGANRAGILTNGDMTLYWHAFKDNEDDEIETCHIYNSIMMDDDTEECAYPWTAENDAFLLNALNSTNEEDIVGDGGLLYGLEFPHSEETVVIGWPHVQDLFEQPGFRENAALCVSAELYNEYGDSAYAVKKTWFDNLSDELKLKVSDGILEENGPEFDPGVSPDGFLTI